MRLKLLVATLFLSLFFGCQESPFMSREDALQIIDEENTSRDPFHQIVNVAAIIDNDIYFFDRLDAAAPRRITNTPSSVKTNVKLSYDNSLIAYMDENSTPVIIKTTDGALVETLSDYNYAASFDWAKDRNTLYILWTNEVFTYGEEMDVVQPETNFSFPWDEVLYYSMNNIGDHASYINFYNGTWAELIYKSDDAGITDEDLRISDHHEIVDFYDNKGGFMLATKSVSYDDIIRNVECFKDYHTWPEYTWDYEKMSTPQFNSDLEILLYGTVENQSYQVKAVYLGTALYEGHGIYDKMTKVFDGITSSNRIYLDWNHKQ